MMIIMSWYFISFVFSKHPNGGGSRANKIYNERREHLKNCMG